MDDPEQDKSLLTVKEVAGILKMNEQTIRNWIDAGTLPAVRIGRAVRIRRADLDQLLERGYNPSTGGAPSPGGGPSGVDFWSGQPVGMADLDADEIDGGADG